ncbi:hypothetical protein RBI13_17920 [Alcaligenaceae bacterium A4P071]|nr:hypothetical protein [Alcaligenaceae bacterium A4P071]
MELNSVQIGIDVATSLAIVASAATFLYDQRKKQKQAKRQQLDDTVRAVSVEKFQDTIHTLSSFFIRDIVGNFQKVDNLIGRDTAELEQLYQRRPELFERAFKQMDTTSDAISQYIDHIHAHKYQIYPLLDSIEGGRNQVLMFRAALSKLIDKYNQINANHRALISELDGLLAYTKEHSFEASDPEILYRRAFSILHDRDYQAWVNTFIPDGQEAVYWEGLANGNVDLNDALIKRVLANFIGHIYEHPGRMLAQVLRSAAGSMIDARTQCKEFLVDLSAINFWLIRKNDADSLLADGELAQTIKRYRGPDMFDLNTEIR